MSNKQPSPKMSKAIREAENINKTNKVFLQIEKELEDSFLMGVAVSLQVIRHHDYKTIADDLCFALGEEDHAKLLHLLKENGGVYYETYLWLTED